MYTLVKDHDRVGRFVTYYWGGGVVGVVGAGGVAGSHRLDKKEK